MLSTFPSNHHFCWKIAFKKGIISWAFYSYDTCGSENSWMEFAGNYSKSVEGLQSIVEDYVREIGIELERYYQVRFNFISRKRAKIQPVHKEVCE